MARRQRPQRIPEGRNLFINVCPAEKNGRVIVRINMPVSATSQPPVLERMVRGIQKCGRIDTARLAHRFPEHTAMLMVLHRIIGRGKIRKRSVYVQMKEIVGHVVVFELE